MERLISRWVGVLIIAGTLACCTWAGTLVFRDADFKSIDLLLSRDQQGWLLVQRGDFQAAAQRFADPYWAGFAAYRAGQWSDAAQQFAKVSTPEALYNKADALAQMGELDKALQAYTQLLSRRPQWPEAVFNRDLLKQHLASAHKKEGVIEDSAKPGQSSSSMQSKEDNAQGDVSKQSVSATANGVPIQPGDGASGQGGQITDANSSLSRQEVSAWMQTLRTTPGAFLQRKFAVQQTEQDKREQIW